MTATLQLTKYLDDLLSVSQFKDYCPNGLQVEGKSEITKLVSGVTACQALIDASIEASADAILVHHGYFWKNEDARVVGMKRHRLQRLLEHQINLLVYHLPLDAHEKFGNNVQLAKVLDFKIAKGHEVDGVPNLLWTGELHKPMLGNEFAAHIDAKLQRPPLFIPAGDMPIKTIAWCTGGAQALIEQAAHLGVDAYLTGEASEQTTHAARELGIHFFAAGHHATERYGTQALAEHLSEKFSIKHEVIDIENPV